jgi:glycosyltransferase involved in cell wall biosynthesis
LYHELDKHDESGLVQSMNRPIAFHLVRGLLGAMSYTPRGIDRIDFGLISYLLEHWPADCVGVMPTPWGIRYFPRERIMAARDRLATMWNEDVSSGEDRAYNDLLLALGNGKAGPYPKPKHDSFITPSGVLRMLRLILGDGVSLGSPVSALPRDAIFLDVGHFGLSTPYFTNWLHNRPDIFPVFMLHDAIPLEYPELVAPDTVLAHEKLMQTTARHAKCLLVPTPSAGAAISATLASRTARQIPIYPVMLPIEDIFSKSALGADAALSSHPYFVVCGAIEQRKNLLLLLEVWKRLFAKWGQAAPRLIIAGTPGYGSDQIMQQFAAQTELDGLVFIKSGLSTNAIARLMSNARGLLMPSLAEGFGLPPLEAMSLGTPAILSDIPVHRDSAGDAGLFIPPDDVESWTQAVTAATHDCPEYNGMKARVKNLKTCNWNEFVSSIARVLDSL